jgi:hypothetical protein
MPPLSELSPAPKLASAFAETILRGYLARGGDIVALFAAFVGVVSHRDEQVGRDALIALDQFVSASGEEKPLPSRLAQV